MGWLLVEIPFGVRIIMRNRDIGECKLKMTDVFASLTPYHVHVLGASIVSDMV